MSSNIDPKTYHSGENNNTTGREPFEDTSRDFIHGHNAGSAVGTGIPGTFGAGVGGTGVGHSTHGLTGATAGATGAGMTGRHGRRGSNSSSSSSSDEEVNGVRQKKTTRTKSKKPIGEKLKEAVGMGGAAAATHGGSHEGASHGLASLHGQRDAYNETATTRGDINTGTSRDPAVSHATGLGGLSGATRQTGDAPGGIQSGNTHFGTGHNLAAEARDHTTGSHHTGTGVGSGIGGAQYGSNTAAQDYSSTTSGLGHQSGHSNIGEDRSAGYARNQGGPGNEGITGNNLSGAAGTDRFDVDRSSSGAYGHNDANKHMDSGVTRTGGDFTNNVTATGGAYANPDAKTGLTGREHTTTGVQDQHGNATEQHSGGLLDKVKGMLGGGHHAA
ncbi:hypothetical protein QFC21_004613 [Naganishia friedmannii]|uniref:Uncharacterized protein n=1 Tax=Naganishia friedmannii TaxID=89922 RepID=A0ACC2VGJ5_9TREE|nr:hypothetical protein QFC21_004613 [Naganishia friedmannii]